MAIERNGSRTAEDVAEMESELVYLRTQLETKERELAVAVAEKSRLQIENALLAGKAQENLVKATRVETIMSQVSAGLVAGLKEMQQERDMARAVRRAVQEDHLERETGSPPAFLRRPAPPNHATSGNVPYDRSIVIEARDEIARSDQLAAGLRGAAEHISPAKLGRIDHTLAGHDARIPPNDYPGPNEDEESLAKLAGDMGSTRG